MLNARSRLYRSAATAVRRWRRRIFIIYIIVCISLALGTAVALSSSTAVINLRKVAEIVERKRFACDPIILAVRPYYIMLY